MDINTILLATDFSDASKAGLRKALLFAKRFDATLHIMHAVDKLDSSWYGFEDAERRAEALRNAIRQEAQQMLTNLVPDDTAVEVKTHVSMQLSFDVSATIVEYASERDIDLVVMGTRGHTKRDQFGLGHVASRVTEKAPCPVLLVGQSAPWATPGNAETLSDVVAPIDFSPHSYEAYGYARSVAGQFDATLHLLFVAEERTIPVFSDTGLPGLQTLEMPPAMVENSRKALQQLIDRTNGPAVEHRIHIKEGEPAPILIDLIERSGIDLAVIATRGHSALKRMLLGSTTRRLLRRAPCPVLTLRAGQTKSA